MFGSPDAQCSQGLLSRVYGPEVRDPLWPSGKALGW